MQEEVKNQSSLKLVSLGSLTIKMLTGLWKFLQTNEGITVPRGADLKGKFKEVKKEEKHSHS